MYGAVRRTPRRPGVLNAPRALSKAGVGSRAASGESLYGSLELKGMDSGREAPARRPSSAAGMAAVPTWGTPVLWNESSVKLGPRWHSLHEARPTKRRAPRTAAAERAPSSPAM